MRSGGWEEDGGEGGGEGRELLRWHESAGKHIVMVSLSLTLPDQPTIHNVCELYEEA